MIRWNKAGVCKGHLERKQVCDIVVWRTFEMIIMTYINYATFLFLFALFSCDFLTSPIKWALDEYEAFCWFLCIWLSFRLFRDGCQHSHRLDIVRFNIQCRRKWNLKKWCWRTENESWVFNRSKCCSWSNWKKEIAKATKVEWKQKWVAGLMRVSRRIVLVTDALGVTRGGWQGNRHPHYLSHHHHLHPYLHQEMVRKTA